jgi:hypothetical protein
MSTEITICTILEVALLVTTSSTINIGFPQESIPPKRRMCLGYYHDTTTT